jgi:hypothetical protein
MELIETRGFSVTSDNEIRWDDRSIKAPWDRVLAVCLAIVAIVFLMPLHVLAFSVALLSFLLGYPRIYMWLQVRSMKTISLDEVPESDVLVENVDGKLQCRGTGPVQYLSALSLEAPGPLLSGNLGRFIRGLDTDFGFMVSVRLEREDPKRVVEEGILSDHLLKFFSMRSSDQMKAYFEVRAGVWRSGIRILGSSYDPLRLSLFCSQVKGAIPVSGLKKMNADSLARVLTDWKSAGAEVSFRATGRELSNWLVQLPSELASEVGGNVPGEFISPIRSGDYEYSVGYAVNPETLKEGPQVGITNSDLAAGLLVCGGEWNRRTDVLAIIIKELIDRGKRVLMISPREEALRLAGIDESGIALTLGKQLILNPVDSEGIARSRYVSELLLLLETLAGADLSSAADFEVALNRVVALGNGTLADITFSEDSLADTDKSNAPPAGFSRSSLLALDAVKRLHEGSGAHAFYGNQTITTHRLTDNKLTVISSPMGAVDLEIFALQLLGLKLSGLDKDEDLVIVLDSPENLRVAASSYRYKKQGVLAYRTVLSLLKRGPLIVSMKNPSSMPSESADALGTCIALRMRDTQDLAAVSDLLSLTVVGGGMHSKKRVSSREGSFLRVMDQGYALMSTREYKTCVPLKLNLPPEMSPVSEAQSTLHAPSDSAEFGRPRTLLDTIGGKDAETVVHVLRLLTKYEPLTEESVRQFLKARGDPDADIEAILARLENASMILRGHENHGGVSYTNYRITMKGTMALRQSEGVAEE